MYGPRARRRRSEVFFNTVLSQVAFAGEDEDEEPEDDDSETDEETTIYLKPHAEREER